MAGSFNKIIIVGNLTKDPETKQFGDKNVCNISVAVNRNVGKNAPEGTKSVDYFRISAWDKLGETCQSYLKKGTSVLFEGRMQFSQYTDKDGNKRESADVVATQMQILTPKGQNEASGDSHEHASVGAPTSTNNATVTDDTDEIPF